MIVKQLELQLTSQDDVVIVRQATRKLAVEIGLTLVDQTKIITAASELARNTVVHGGGGKATLQLVVETAQKGLRLIFEDNGPGIADLDRAMSDGFSTGGGLGLGLGGSKRLCSDFSIESRIGVGTRVTIARWKPHKPTDAAPDQRETSADLAARAKATEPHVTVPSGEEHPKPSGAGPCPAAGSQPASLASTRNDAAPDQRGTSADLVARAGSPLGTVVRQFLKRPETL